MITSFNRMSLMCFVLFFYILGHGNGNEVSYITRSPGGLIQLHLPLSSDKYAVLHRDDSLTGTKRAIYIVQGNGDLSIARDPAPIPRSGFLRLQIHQNSRQVDTDGDGISDLTEMNSPGLMNPLNSASAIGTSKGRVHIPDKQTYETLSHRDNFPGSANISEVKFVIYDIHTKSPKLYFVNSKRYEYHYTFSRDAVNRYNSNSLFNNHTYFTNSRRRNTAGSIVYHPNYVSPSGQTGIYTVEFWPADPVAFRFIETSFEMIVSSMPFLDGQIAYHPASETHRTLHQSEISQYKKSHVAVIDSEDLFGNSTYSALNTGECFGTLKFITGAQTMSSRDIVILRNIPNDITHVSGIITEQNQTPLSHINLKAKQNGTPNAYLKNASTDPRITPLIGQNVKLSISPDGIEIRIASQEETEDYFEKIRPSKTSFPERNLNYDQIAQLSDIDFSMSSAFGAKATNLAELNTIIPSITPHGYAIPFYFYDAFMKHNGFYVEAEQMMDDTLFQSFPSVRENRLKEFRNRIKETGILPNWMLNALNDLQESFPDDAPIRARSSTNNEDLQGFNGAGLYESYTHYKEEGHFAKTAKQVWAGLWTYRAFEERDFWRIDHMSAAMGILVHQNFQNETSNGVGVTKNIYLPGPGWEGHYVNVQIGENLVTNPEPGSIPEEYIIANLGFGSNYEIQYIRNSNQIETGQRILTRSQALRLRDYMDIVHAHFKNLYRGNSNFAMEIEFKLIGNGQFIIKQARPWVE